MKTIVTHPNFDYMQSWYQDKGKFAIGSVKHERFWDGWPNFFLENVKEVIEHQDVTYIWDFSQPRSALESYMMIRAITWNVADKVRIIMPFFPVATMEREDTKWQVVTAKYLADIMSLMPPWRSMKTSIHNFDIHAVWVKNYYDEFKVTPELHTTMELIKQKIDSDTVIIFPDEGAYKRYKWDFEEYDTVICEKRREWNERIVRIKEWNITWKKGIIIDDLIQTWWTLIECADVLRKNGAIQLDAYAPHWVFPKKSHTKVADAFDTLYVSDSIPKNIKRASKIKNMQILEIEPLIKKIIF